MKTKLFSRLIAFSIFLFAISMNLMITNNPNDQEVTLEIINMKALASGESSDDCPETCFTEKCDPEWEDVNCRVYCGTHSCNFSYASSKN